MRDKAGFPSAVIPRRVGWPDVGKLWAVDLATHEVAWSYPVGGAIVLSTNQLLYLAPVRPTTLSNRLIAFKLR